MAFALTDELSKQGRKLLAVPNKDGDWVNRAELAEAIGKAKLSAYHMMVLELLANKGAD